MITLESWLEKITDWYQNRKHDPDETLQKLILSAPDSIWGPEVTEQQSKAIACWLDGCLRLFQSMRYQDPTKAYPFLQLASSKLQATASQPIADIELRDWSMKRLQHLTVLALEFCNQQPQADWQQESTMLIESHVQFMAAHSWNEPRKHDQGNRRIH